MVSTYQDRTEEERYSKRISMDEIKKNDHNLNISRYVSTAQPEEAVDLHAVNSELLDLQKKIVNYTKKHNKFLNELGLPPLP